MLVTLHAQKQTQTVYCSTVSGLLLSRLIFGETDQIHVVVVIGEDRFGLVTEAEEKLYVPGRPEHGARIKFMGIGRYALNFPHQLFPHTLTLVGWTHGEEPNDTDTPHGPETN